MDRGTQSMMIGIIFIIIAAIIIYIQTEITIWTGLVLAFSVLNIIFGIIIRNKESKIKK